MKIYIVDYPEHAGHWIYKGYRLAWEKLGFDVEIVDVGRSLGAADPYKNLLPVTNLPKEYMIMYPDVMCQDPKTLEIIEKSYKSFIWAASTIFPSPWGRHPNFVCQAPDTAIIALNKMENVYLWTFGDNTEYHHKWKKTHTVPLAFDSISYVPIKNESYAKYDISFVGGWANNGFNEKRKIMIKHFSEFSKSGLNCGFFIEKNLTHKQENALLYNSKLSLNIHDHYQRVLGYDTNERTFKSIGLNGILVSDTVGQLNRIFPDLETSLDSKKLVQLAKDYLSLSKKEINEIKEKNRQMILKEHCYTNRVQQLLNLPVVDTKFAGVPEGHWLSERPSWQNFLNIQ